MAREKDKSNNQETGLANSSATNLRRRSGIESTSAALLGFNFTKRFGQFNKIFSIITPCKFLSFESKLFKSLPTAFWGVFVRTIAANASKSSFTNENGLVWTGEIKTNTLGVVGHILLRFRRYF